MVEKQHVFLHLDLTVNLVDTYLKRTLVGSLYFLPYTLLDLLMF